MMKLKVFASATNTEVLGSYFMSDIEIGTFDTYDAIEAHLQKMHPDGRVTRAPGIGSKYDRDYMVIQPLEFDTRLNKFSNYGVRDMQRIPHG